MCLLCTMGVPIFGAKTPDASKLSNPRTAGDTVTWDRIWFGHYPQSSNRKVGTTMIPSNGGYYLWKPVKYYLLVDKNLDAKGIS